MSMQSGMMTMMNRGQTSAGILIESCPMMKSLAEEGTTGDHSDHHPPNK